jgi:hypothetical protein
VANAIHFICRHGDRNMPENVSSDPITKLFESGSWDITVTDAEALLGGWLYLQETKLLPSYLGGPIEGYAPVMRDDVAHKARIALKFRPSVNGKAQKWRGNDHARAWTSGQVVTI